MLLFEKAKYLITAILLFFSLNGFSLKIAFQEDFADSLTGWSVIDSSGVNAIWTFTSTPPVNFVTEIGANPGFTTASNGYLMVDSDTYGVSNQHTELVSPRIDCSNLGEVILEFEQHYYHYAGASTSVWVRTESSNYIEFPVNTSFTVNNTGTTNPELITIDLSAMAAGKDSVYIKYVWKGDWSWWWLIDDMIVFDPEKFDATVFNMTKSKVGTILPLVQSKSLSFTNDVSNIGVGTMTNVEVLYSIYNSSSQIVFADSVTVDSIPQGDTVAFQTNIVFNADYADAYYMKYFVSSDQVDIDPSNDQDTLWVVISDSTYARNNGESNVVSGVGFPAGTGSFGNIFKLYEPDTLTSISFFLASDKSGDQTSFTIHEWSGDTTVAVVYDVPAFTLSSATFNQWATVDNLSVALEAKEYLVVINQITNDSNISIGADMNQAEEQLVGSPKWTVYKTFGAPLLRPNFGSLCKGLTVNQTVTDIACQSNSSGKIDLSISGGNSGFSYSWSNGATTKNISNLNVGYYMVTVTDAAGCMAMAGDSITEPSSIMSLTNGFVDATCAQANGSASITATGGTPPYTYNWSNGGTVQ